MKLIVSILLLFSTAFTAGLLLDIYELSDFEISIFDTSNEGSSEKESSENAEDDSETDCFDLDLYIPNLSLETGNPLNIKKETPGHYKELSDPPPRVA